MTTETHPTATLRAQLAGSVLSPSDAAYEDARRVHNGLALGPWESYAEPCRSSISTPLA